MKSSSLPAQGPLPSRNAARDGFTLIEMLVSLTITLIMMGAVVTLFGVVTDTVSGSRAVVEISDRLRATRNRLQADLMCTTSTMNPPLRPEMDEGYFLVAEGTATDAVDTSGTARDMTTVAGLFGDTDDILAFTVHSRGEPFVAMVAGVAMESPMAEVIYFVDHATDSAGNPADPIFDPLATPTPTRLFTLYRRVLLIAPRLAGSLGAAPIGVNYYNTYDLSARVEAGVRVPNTLGDLTKHENRFGHLGSAFPWRYPYPTRSAPLLPLSGNRLGDDVLLTNVLAFDVQVFDPGAPLAMSTGATPVALEPRDPGYSSGTAASVFGAYVDLGYTANGSAPNAIFKSTAGPNPKSKGTTRPFVYDTWSLHYENNGIDEDSTNGADSGMNGLDDNGDGVVDDLAEMDTLPPYSAPLRAVRITIRVYEPGSKEVREVTVVQDFLPE